MKYLMIEDRNTGAREVVSLEEAEHRSCIDRTEIEWAIEECGVCDGIDHSITDTRGAEDVVTAGRTMEAEMAGTLAA